jgi:hypothetical protein
MKLKNILASAIAAVGLAGVLGYSNPVMAQGLEEVSPANIEKFKIDHETTEKVGNEIIREIDGHGFAKNHKPIHIHSKVIKIKNEEGETVSKNVVITIETDGEKLIIKDNKNVYTKNLNNNKKVSRIVEKFVENYQNTLNEKENIRYEENINKLQTDGITTVENNSKKITANGNEYEINTQSDLDHPSVKEYKINDTSVAEATFRKKLKVGEKKLKNLLKIRKMMM